MRATDFILEGIEEQVFSQRQWPSLSKAIAAGIQNDHTIDDQYAETDEGLREVARQLIAIDPTKRGSYAPTVIKWYGNGEFYIGEDAQSITSFITQFEQLKQRLPVEQRDITRMARSQAVEAVNELIRADKQAKLQAAKAKRSAEYQHVEGGCNLQGTGKILINDGDFAVVVPTSLEEARKLGCSLWPENAMHSYQSSQFGQATDWCTLSTDMYEHYSKQGPLYNIILHCGDPEKMRMYQLHYESSQFKDENDREIGEKEIALLSQFPGYKKLLNSLIKKHYSKYVEQ